MKKIFIAAAMVSTLALSVFAKGPDFSNTISTDIVDLTTNDNDNWYSSFAGISNNTRVELLTSRVDAEIDVTFKFDDAWINSTVGNIFYAGNFNTDHINDAFKINSWYIEFRPIERLTFGLNPLIWTSGSYLPVANSNIAGGNIGSSFDIVVRPINGLRLALGIDFLSYFGTTETNGKQYPKINFGFDWTYGKLYSIGLSVRNVANGARSVGVYGEYAGLKGFDFRAGYTYNGNKYNGDISMGGFGNIDLNAPHMINGAVTFTQKQLTLVADTAIAFANSANTSENFKDMYIGAKVAYAITNNFTIAGKFETAFDFAGKAGNVMLINPYVTGYIKNHELGAGFKLTLNAGKPKIGFPIYWKFSI